MSEVVKPGAVHTASARMIPTIITDSILPQRRFASCRTSRRHFLSLTFRYACLFSLPVPFFFLLLLLFIIFILFEDQPVPVTEEFSVAQRYVFFCDCKWLVTTYWLPYNYTGCYVFVRTLYSDIYNSFQALSLLFSDFLIQSCCFLNSTIYALSRLVSCSLFRFPCSVNKHLIAVHIVILFLFPSFKQP